MKRTITLLALLLTFALGATLALADGTTGPTPTPGHSKTKTKKVDKGIWVCPMGDYKGPKTADGKCPTCKMDLEKFVPKKEKGAMKEGASKPSAAAPEARRVAWTCPMCGGNFDKAGKCPDCGMDLVKKK